MGHRACTGCSIRGLLSVEWVLSSLGSTYVICMLCVFGSVGKMTLCSGAAFQVWSHPASIKHVPWFQLQRLEGDESRKGYYMFAFILVLVFIDYSFHIQLLSGLAPTSLEFYLFSSTRKAGDERDRWELLFTSEWCSFSSLSVDIRGFIHGEMLGWAVLCLVAQSCPTVCDPMDCIPPGFSVHGDSPGKNTGVSCYALFQGIFPTRGSNTGLLHCRWILYCLSHHGSPRI